MSTDFVWNRDIHGQQLKDARLDKDLSRREVGEKVDVSGQVVYTWEIGSSEPKGKILESLVQLFGKETFQGRESEEPESLPLAEWLMENRERAGMSRQTLADKAGLSYLTITKIENGETVNPHQRTIDALETALNSQISDVVARKIEQESNIEGVGHFTDFNPHLVLELPDTPGIYVFYDISERPIYIGQANNIKKRISDPHTGHIDKFWYRYPIVASAAYIPIADESLRKKIEAVMIRFLKSNAVLNKAFVKRDGPVDN